MMRGTTDVAGSTEMWKKEETNSNDITVKSLVYECRQNAAMGRVR